MDTLTLTYHQDPGHGWIEIPRTLARQVLGSAYSRISPCSYRRGNQLFLEEDCDAPLLLNAARAAGLTVHLNEQHINQDSFIRSLPPFTP